MCNEKQKNREGEFYIKKNHITVQSFNQSSFPKIYHMIVLGNDVKQMETLRDTKDWKKKRKEEREKKLRRRKEKNIKKKRERKRRKRKEKEKEEREKREKEKEEKKGIERKKEGKESRQMNIIIK